ncbi:MAG: SDR family NAD(P)-dependent oxidoreductase [Bacteroidales bacterium]
MSEPKARRVAVVTGGGTGIGSATVRRLADAGYSVLATVRNGDRARELSGHAAASGKAVRYLALELGDLCQIEAIAAEVEQCGGAELLVHNAGFGVFGAVEDVDGPSTERQFAVNVFGPLALTRLLLPGLRARGGRVIWVGSLAGRIPLPFQAHYSATKSAIATISDAMRHELRPHGVFVTCVEPSDFATGFTGSRVVGNRPGSAYGEAAARCLREVEKQETGAPDPDWVARVIERVARQSSPPARVPVGKNARLLCLLLRVLPASLAERMIAAHYGL